MTKLTSLSLFVGTGKCNAYCAHCAGVIHRKHAPKEDGTINEKLIYDTLKNCYEDGARSLSVSSSGEPTLSPLALTKTFDLIEKCANEGIQYSPINLYSNGIIIGNDKMFCDTYFSKWKEQGLSNIYVTVHSIDNKKNAQAYGVDYYPPLENILERIHNIGLKMRANLMLSKGTIHTYEQFLFSIDQLLNRGVDFISSWPIRNADDKQDLQNSPSEEEMDKMEKWIKNNNYPVKLLREKNRYVYTTGQKLTLFPDGKLSNSWCN